jgi:hypothetical protein
MIGIVRKYDINSGSENYYEILAADTFLPLAPCRSLPRSV